LVYNNCLFALLLIFASCAPASPSRSEYALGTVCTVTLFEQSKDSVYRDIFARIREIDNLMSVNIPSSDVSRINAAAGIAGINVNKDTFTVIERAVFFAEISGGAFDPSVGPLVSLWGIGGDDASVPSQEEIDKTLPMINWQDIELDAGTHSVFLKREGMALDLGAIAKGYAADEAAALIKNAGIKRAIIDFGGNIVTLGEKKDKTPWKIGIQNPNERRGLYFGVLQVKNTDSKQTIVTSGVNERFFEKDGVRYHHILSTSTGYPVRDGLLSVTIIAANSMDADALSTTLFALGYEEGVKLLGAFQGTEVVFVFEDNSVRVTPGADFSVIDEWFVRK
jgi:thiamine biosynthesis lipoprotein